MKNSSTLTRVSLIRTITRFQILDLSNTELELEIFFRQFLNMIYRTRTARCWPIFCYKFWHLSKTEWPNFNAFSWSYQFFCQSEMLAACLTWLTSYFDHFRRSRLQKLSKSLKFGFENFIKFHHWIWLIKIGRELFRAGFRSRPRSPYFRFGEFS